MSDGEDKPMPLAAPPVAAGHAGRASAQAGLLFLGMPLLAPSLLWMLVLEKRWARAPLAAIALHAALLVYLSAQVPRMAFVSVIAIAATAALYLWRSPEGAAGRGICLGYSRAVVLSFAAGGALTMLGTSAVLPMGALMHTSSVYRSPANVTTKDLADNKVVVPRRIEVKDAKVDPGRAFYRLPGPPAWFERMPPEQKSDALETWVPLEGTHDEVWVVFMGTNLVRMTDVVEGHLVDVLPVDATALGTAQGLGAAPQPHVRHKKHGQPSSPAAAPAPSVARLVLVGSPQEVADRTNRTDETKITFDWKWAWLLAVGLVLVAFALWRSVEESRA